MTEAQDRVQRLRAELHAAERDMLAEREEIRNATPVLYQYWIEPVEPKDMRHYKLYDPTCQLYNLTRKVTNPEEAREARHAEHELVEGSMKYLYNTETFRIVCAIGGGTIYISNAWPGKWDNSADEMAFSRIGVFLKLHPAGGDITAIVNQYIEDRDRP